MTHNLLIRRRAGLPKPDPKTTPPPVFRRRERAVYGKLVGELTAIDRAVDREHVRRGW